MTRHTFRRGTRVAVTVENGQSHDFGTVLSVTHGVATVDWDWCERCGAYTSDVDVDDLYWVNDVPAEGGVE